MYKNGNTFHETEIIINKNSIITNAHNVYEKDSIRIYQDIIKKKPLRMEKLKLFVR